MGRSDPGGARPGPLTDAGEESGLVTLPRLMLVTDRLATRGRDLVDVVEAAVAGGVGLVQVRERDLSEAAVEILLGRLLDRLRGSDARLVVNGHPALARAFGIGLHLPAAAPTAVPRRTFTGRSVHDEEEAMLARAEGVSYVVAGPIFPTSSKPGHPGAGVALVGPARPDPRAHADPRDRRPHAGAGGVRAAGRGIRRRRAERDPGRRRARAGRARVRRGSDRGLRGGAAFTQCWKRVGGYFRENKPNPAECYALSESGPAPRAPSRRPAP